MEGLDEWRGGGGNLEMRTCKASYWTVLLFQLLPITQDVTPNDSNSLPASIILSTSPFKLKSFNFLFVLLDSSVPHSKVSPSPTWDTVVFSSQECSCGSPFENFCEGWSTTSEFPHYRTLNISPSWRRRLRKHRDEKHIVWLYFLTLFRW